RGLPALHRDRARRRDLPVVHGGPRARGCASPDRCGTQVITWPFDWTVYVGLVGLYFGHAWLARASSYAQRKHAVYLLAGLVSLFSGPSSRPRPRRRAGGCRPAPGSCTCCSPRCTRMGWRLPSSSRASPSTSSTPTRRG